jgi:RND family efflux transporter MFP subunit
MRGRNWHWWLIAGLVVIGAVAGVGFLVALEQAKARAGGPEPARRSGPGRVEVTRPRKGETDRSTVQTASVEPFESARLFAAVPGYLKTQNVDIGDHVKKGQELAKVDVPELDRQVERYAALLDQANARVTQMEAHVEAARADLEAEKAGVEEAEANAKSKAADLRFRTKQLQRLQALARDNSIDERRVDEVTEQQEASQEAANAAQSAIAHARARVAAADAKIKQADADVKEARAEVKVGEAELARARVMAAFATITSPYEGVITQRSLYPGDFVKAAEGAAAPLLTVERTDLLRVVLYVPEADVPYCHVGDPAVVELNALPGRKFEGKVSRLAHSEDRQTRLMRVEVDLPNPTGAIAPGMFGRVTILLEKSQSLSVPSSALVGKVEGAKATVFVVRDGHAHQVPVRVGSDNGLRVAVLDGLMEDDEVVVHPGGLTDGAAVVAAPEE